MGRRAIVLLMTMAAALVVASGVAWAATVYCTPGAYSCSGTNSDDVIYGTYGADKILPREGDDLIGAADGNDIVRTHSDDGGSNTVYAGSGNDRVNGKIGNDNLHGEGGVDDLGGQGGPIACTARTATTKPSLPTTCFGADCTAAMATITSTAGKATIT